jgi:hypothetical protein
LHVFKNIFVVLLGDTNYECLQYGRTVNDIVTWFSLQELCVDHQELMPAVKLAKLLHPELNERAIRQQCYGGHASMMTHDDIIRWLMEKDKTVRNIMNF